MNWPASFLGPPSCLPPQGNLRGHEPPRGCNSLPGCKRAPKVLYNLLVEPRKGVAPQDSLKPPVALPFGTQGGGRQGRPGPATWTPEPVYTAFWGGVDISHLWSFLK